MSLFDNLENVEDRFREVEGLLSDPTVTGNQSRYRDLTREHAELSEVVQVYRRYKQVREEIVGNQELLTEADPEMKELAREELASLSDAQEQLEQQLKLLLLPKDPNDERNIILEIRAGTGGDEAAGQTDKGKSAHRRRASGS